jgi:hypothetical protein
MHVYVSTAKILNKLCEYSTVGPDSILLLCRNILSTEINTVCQDCSSCLVMHCTYVLVCT